MGDSQLATLLLIWMGAVVALAVGRSWRRTPGTGLVLAYVLNLWLIHWVAPALYLLPWYQGFDHRIVEAGLQQSTFAVVAFAFASLVLTPFLLNFGILPRGTARVLDRRLPLAYVGMGAASYGLLSLGVGAVPSATAIISTGQQLVIVGLALCCWLAWRSGSKRKLVYWLSVTALLPFITIVTRGFIGYGAVAALTVLIFISGFIRPRALVFAMAILVGYVGLSVFVTYMRDRGEIRDTVWGGQSMQVRVSQLEKTLTDFEWFDISNNEHLSQVDGRLNQSYLAGLAVSRLSDTGEYVHGDTLWEALFALVPRALWPDKPIEAGSGNMVSEYTGLRFAAGTSVGIGHVMEFYVNFGTPGVICGFLVMGVLVTTLDGAAAERLAMSNLHGFVVWFLPGISLLQVGGSLVEATVSAVASIAVAFLANRYLDHLQGKQPDAVRNHERLTARHHRSLSRV
jgi:hypothetical protein